MTKKCFSSILTIQMDKTIPFFEARHFLHPTDLGGGTQEMECSSHAYLNRYRRNYKSGPHLHPRLE